MITKLVQTIWLVVPTGRAHSTVVDELGSVSRFAKGLTVVQSCCGEWFDEAGARVSESVLRYEWAAFDEWSAGKIRQMVVRCADTMLARGEQAVLSSMGMHTLGE